MISYTPLWHVMTEHRHNKMLLVEAKVISRGTLAKLGKDESVSLDIIDRICQFYHVGIENVVRIVDDDKITL